MTDPSAPTNQPRTSGVILIGAGLEGVALGEHIVGCGIPLHVATRKSLAEQEDQLKSLIPGARAATLTDIPDLPADLLTILAVPLSATETISPDLLAGRVVVDLMNYWPKLDAASSFAATPRDTSSRVAELFPDARVVKTLNHMGHLDIAFDARPASDTFRRAQAVAGDDAGAKQIVANFLADIGYDAVDIGPLANGRYVGPGTEIFGGGWRTADQIARIVSRRSGVEAGLLAPSAR